MSVEGDTLPPVPQHTPPLQGQAFKFDVKWMQWFVDLRVKLNVINGPVLLPSAGGTGISTYVVGDLLYASGTQTLSRLAAGAAGYVLTGNGAGVAPSYQSLPAATSAGSQINSNYNSSATVASNATTTIPFDNTIPQNTEGDAYPSLDTSITPLFASSKLKVTVFFPLVSGSTTIDVTLALFRDSDADAIAVETVTIDANNFSRQATLCAVVNANSTSATTFKVRWGRSGSTGYINRTGGSANLFGGVLKAWMLVEEIKQ